MEKENGGSLSVDLNENEEGGGGGGKAGHKSRLTLPTGVSGGQEAGKGHIYVTGNERNVNTHASVRPPSHDRDIMLDLVAAREYLSGQFADRCEISGDHSGLNGFTESESLGQDEPTMVELEEGGGEGGTGAASCPAVLLGRISAETGRQMRQHPTGESQGETPDSDDVSLSTGGGAVPDCTRTSLQQELPCTARHQQMADVNMPNGDVDSPGFGGRRADLGVFSSQGLGSCDGVEVKVANGGLHIVNAARATCDPPDSDCSPEIKADIDWDLQARQENPSWSCFYVKGRNDCSGYVESEYPVEDSPGAAELPHFLDPSAFSKEPTTPGSSAKFSSPCPSTLSNLNGDSPLSDPNTRDDEDFSDPSLPVRPQSLRTNPNLVVSLSCDATPLSPDGDGGYYFGGEDYEEELRNVLEAGRRQSAPDNLPDLTEHADGSDPKLMPKRFGIADFFTR